MSETQDPTSDGPTLNEPRSYAETQQWLEERTQTLEHDIETTGDANGELSLQLRRMQTTLQYLLQMDEAEYNAAVGFMHDGLNAALASEDGVHEPDNSDVDPLTKLRVVSREASPSEIARHTRITIVDQGSSAA